MTTIKIQSNPSGGGSVALAAPITSQALTLSLPDVSGTVLVSASSGTAGQVLMSGGSAPPTWSPTTGTGQVVLSDSPSFNGGITFSGSQARIEVSSVATPVKNRTFFQSKDENSNTYIGVIPRGNGTTSGITFSNREDPDNAGYAYIIMGPDEFILSSVVSLGDAAGWTPDGVRMTLKGRLATLRLDDGVLVTAGALGYGVGAGGTVIQQTSKSTYVTLNKPSGRIETHNASLAAGATVQFQFVNNTVGMHDTATASVAWGLNDPLLYRVEMFSYSVAPGTLLVKLTNIGGAALAEKVYINFAVVKGAIS